MIAYAPAIASGMGWYQHHGEPYRYWQITERANVSDVMLYRIRHVIKFYTTADSVVLEFIATYLISSPQIGKPTAAISGRFRPAVVGGIFPLDGPDNIGPDGSIRLTLLFLFPRDG